MNTYIVKLFYQIEYYAGWSDKSPKSDYVRTSYKVNSELPIEELLQQLSTQKRDKYLHVLIDNEAADDSGAITEEDILKIIRHAHLRITPGN